MVPALTIASPLHFVMSPCCMTSCVFFGKVKRCPPALECAAHILTTLCAASAERGLVSLSVHCICICKGVAPACACQLLNCHGSVSLPGKGDKRARLGLLGPPTGWATEASFKPLHSWSHCHSAVRAVCCVQESIGGGLASSLFLRLRQVPPRTRPSHQPLFWPAAGLSAPSAARLAHAAHHHHNTAERPARRAGRG